MRTMGVNCDNSAVHIAVVEGGRVIDGVPDIIETMEGLEEEARLEAILGDIGRVVDEIRPDRVALLRPETNYRATHEQFVRRITLETLVRLAAARAGVQLDRASRQGVRAALKLPRTGSLDSHLGTVFPQPVGGRWRQGRGLAAMAARAAEER